MDSVLLIVGLLLVAGLLYVGAVYFSKVGPTFDMHNTFAGLEPLAGKTLNEVIVAAGQPAESAAGMGCAHYTWRRGEFEIVLGFDESDVCVGMVHLKSMAAR